MKPEPIDDGLDPSKALIARRAVKAGLLSGRSVVSIVDLDGIAMTVERLRHAFPAHFIHAFAVKANFLVPVLKRIRMAGMGAEVASAGEIELARRAGFAPDETMFDAPVKTRDELRAALAAGLAINIDNFEELADVAGLLGSGPPQSLLGLRINPQIGAGSALWSSTATRTSKFGIALCDDGNRDALIAAYRRHQWLRAIHVHVGSVGCPLELMAKGAGDVVELAEAVNRAVGTNQITSIDIGGGLPVDFSRDDGTPDFAGYARILARVAPALFERRYRVITEFGRAVMGKNALTLARVERTKTMGGRAIALTQAGAHNLMRLVHQPHDSRRRISALGPDGVAKSGAPLIQDIAGPACFAGDIIGHERVLPRLEAGDIVLVHDTGAYGFSTPYYYNARPPDAVYGFEAGQKNNDGFIKLHAGQDVAALADMFS